MSTTEAIIQREIDRDAAEIQRALDRGGLPTEAEVRAVYESLTDLIEHLEGLTWRVEGIASSDCGNHLPFEVSLEQIGLVGMLAADARGELATLTNMVERISGQVTRLSAIRAEQQYRRRDEG
jgi:hypothetical protein